MCVTSWRNGKQSANLPQEVATWHVLQLCVYVQRIACMHLSVGLPATLIAGFLVFIYLFFFTFKILNALKDLEFELNLFLCAKCFVVVVAAQIISEIIL